jgi:hypothetical protein
MHHLERICFLTTTLPPPLLRRGPRDRIIDAATASGATLHQMATVAAAMLAGGGGPDAGAEARRAADARAAAVAAIRLMPERPLELLHRMVELMRVRAPVTDRPRRWCVCVFLNGGRFGEMTVSDACLIVEARAIERMGVQ